MVERYVVDSESEDVLGVNSVLMAVAPLFPCRPHEYPGYLWESAVVVYHKTHDA